MPPVQAGMEPSALPAFSPPSGVRSLPSRFASLANCFQRLILPISKALFIAT